MFFIAIFEIRVLTVSGHQVPERRMSYIAIGIIRSILFDRSNQYNYTLIPYWVMEHVFFRILEICVLTVSGHQVPERQRWSRDLTMGFGPYPLFNLIFLIKLTPNYGFSNGRRTIRSFKKCNLTAPGDHQVTKLSKSLAPFLQRGFVGIFFWCLLGP